MHFEILVEDISGKTALEILIPKIISSEQHTFNIHPYKGKRLALDTQIIGNSLLLIYN